MKRLLAIGFLVWLCSSLFLVRGNEIAIVRRFGQLQTWKNGEPRPRNSGLSFDLPWPFSTITRINLNEVQTCRIGELELETDEPGQLLLPQNSGSRARFLTGDRNILKLAVTVRFRVDGDHLRDYLTQTENPKQHLQTVAQAVVCDFISRSGVDYVHPLGLGELLQRLTLTVANVATERKLGLIVESVVIDAVYPPARVQPDFVDVASARADYNRYVEAARSYAEQRLSAAQSAARQRIDAAETYRQQTLADARGTAHSIAGITAEFAESRPQRSALRRTVAHRLWRETVADIFKTTKRQIVVKDAAGTDVMLPNPSRSGP